MAVRERKSLPRRDAMLLVVDAQNLYYSARELYGKGSRIDFLRLKEKIVGERVFGAVYGVAFVPVIRDDTASLAKALKRLGYEILERSERFDAQVRELERLMGSYSVLAVASGSGDFLPLYRVVREQQKKVEVYSFADAANGEIPQNSDSFIKLDLTVLMGDYSTVDALKG